MTYVPKKDRKNKPHNRKPMSEERKQQQRLILQRARDKLQFNRANGIPNPNNTNKCTTNKSNEIKTNNKTIEDLISRVEDLESQSDFYESVIEDELQPSIAKLQSNTNTSENSPDENVDRLIKQVKKMKLTIDELENCIVDIQSNEDTTHKRLEDVEIAVDSIVDIQNQVEELTNEIFDNTEQEPAQEPRQENMYGRWS